MLLGVIALGSMSFIEVNCFAVANATQATFDKLVPSASDAQSFAVWEAAFTNCEGAQSSLTEPATITIKK